jgi:hypothetical protein
VNLYVLAFRFFQNRIFFILSKFLEL